MEYNDGSNLHITYDPALEAIKFKASIAQSTYLGFGYGVSMTNVDMVAWIADSASSSQIEMYGIGETAPTQLPQNAYTTTIDSWNATYTEFTSTRPLAITEPSTYQIPLEEPFPVIWAFAETPYVNWHDTNYGFYTIYLFNDGSCEFFAELPNANKFTWHGILMGISWTLITLA